MSKRLPSVVFLLLVIVLLCAGCSIKEDRSECPCTLVLNLNDVRKEYFSFLTVRAESSDGFLFQDIVPCSGLSDRLILKVPRTDIRVNVVGEAVMNAIEEGDDACVPLGEIRNNGSYIIPEWSECPPVYLFMTKVSTVSDLVEVPVSLKKNYCRISIEMLAVQSYEFGLGIVGNFCGYDVAGRPLPGDFGFSSIIKNGKVVEVSVPRQEDNSLRMQLSDTGDGGVVREFALGEYIAAVGYDWAAEELEDIHVVIDYVRTKITFKVRDWEKVFEFDVVI